MVGVGRGKQMEGMSKYCSSLLALLQTTHGGSSLPHKVCTIGTKSSNKQTTPSLRASLSCTAVSTQTIKLIY